MHDLVAAVPVTLTAVALAGVGAWVLYLDPHRPATRAFAALLILRGLTYAPTGLLHGAWAVRFDVAVRPPLDLALPFLAIAFAFAYPRPRDALARRTLLPWSLVAGAAALAIVALVDPSAYWTWTPAQRGVWTGYGFAVAPAQFGWLWHAGRGLQLVAYAGLGALFAWEAWRTPDGPVRRGLALVAAGWSVRFASWIGAALYRYPAGDGPIPPVLDIRWAEAIVMALTLAAAWFLLRAWRASAASDRRTLGFSLVVLILGAAAGFTAAALGSPRIGPWQLGPLQDLLWAVSLAGFVAYALLRHRILDLDLKLKRTIRHGTVVGLLAAAFLVVSLGAELVLDPGTARIVGLAATAAMLLALVPLQRVGARVADAALPGVPATPASLDERRLAAYRIALEEVLDERAAVGPRDARMLERLRERLGVTDRDHAILVQTLASGAGASHLALRPGESVLGRYRILEQLGAGGEGRAYRARDTLLDRDVVVKALHDPARAPRALLKEARVLATLDHPNVVRALDVELVGEQVFLVLEHVDGGSLRDRLDRGPLEGEAFSSLARDVLSGLGAVHDAGLVHRDVKPSNVLLTREGRAKIADFGIARTQAASATRATVAPGTARGTIQYMSPEQARGRRVDVRSDLYSAAATLYEARTGGPYMEPRPGESPVELQMRIASARAFDRAVDPPPLRAWFAKALAPDPGDRFASAREMRDALERALAGPRRAGARPRRAPNRG